MEEQTALQELRRLWKAVQLSSARDEVLFEGVLPLLASGFDSQACESHTDRRAHQTMPWMREAFHSAAQV